MFSYHKICTVFNIKINCVQLSSMFLVNKMYGDFKQKPVEFNNLKKSYFIHNFSWLNLYWKLVRLTEG